MADLLTEKGAERGRCYPHSVATIIGVRECYLHSYAISKSRAGVSAGLGGFVGFRQLPSWPDECAGLAKINWASVSERPTRVTAENLRSRRPSFWPAHGAHAPLARKREWGAEGLPHAKVSRGEASRVRADYINIRSLGTSALKGAEVPRFWFDVVLNLSISALKGAEMLLFWRESKKQLSSRK